METNNAAGMLLVIIAGSFSGTFAIPFKFNTKWQWENNWAVWSVFALLITPWIVSLVTVPKLFEIYSESIDNVLLVALFGTIWGIGAILFGRGIHYLGVSLSLPIMLGLINSVGTIMPIVYKNPADLFTQQGVQILLGVAILLVGIVIVSIAGSKNDSENEDETGRTKKAFTIGLIVCILAGIFGPMVNFAFVFGEPMQLKAIELGTSTTFASNTVWSIALTCGFVTNFGYCIYLLKKNGTDKQFNNAGIKHWIFAALSGLIWYGSVMFYGVGSNKLGEMGASVGWVLMQSLAIIAGNVSGILAGEWKNANHRAMRLMTAGMVVLVLGVLIIAYV
ncbi:L-rhamnose/proton symporter RhaT [uncultured Draconibacterium sp.]|uniref:L-rhamnose/proton symporter RhaT n=1 Tax=uncultured Draconibacterium sp. TaxID=1573823 RepID=UPI0029C025AC|nr:L-rhamnose/proton symporter RhaT [uncultured Draconibacterium sp.]